MLEEVADRPIGAEVAAVLAERVAYFGDGAGPVVGKAVDEDRRTCRAVALVAHFVVGHALELARAALDGARHAVLGHVGLARFLEREAQTRVAVWVAAAGFRRHRDFTDEAREAFAFFGISRRLAVLDVRPFAVPRHSMILRHAIAAPRREERPDRALPPPLARQSPRAHH